LIATLSPQERAAVVLKDAFDLSLDEVADLLSTTPNAVKAALHRGRTKLEERTDEVTDRVPVPAALDKLVAAFNAHDLDRVAAVLLDTAIVEVVGATTVFSATDARTRVLSGLMFGSERIAQAETRGGIDARFMQGILPLPARLEIREYRGEPIVLSWYAHVDGDAVRAVNRVDVEDDRVARLRNYFFNAELLVEICEELGVPYRSNGHQFWLKGNA
jgi:RNA polymerase sigma-70 factor (ECF subfamily)